MSGYSCLIGTFRVRIPMLIAMLLFIRVSESQDDIYEVSKRTYTYCWVMHLALSFIDLVAYLQGVVYLSSYFEAF